MTKQEQINVLYEKYKREFSNEEIVLGDGKLDTNLLLIGEAPGKDEVKLSRPFVGMAGKNLAEFLEILNIKREEIYITNAIKYRLSKINPSSGKVINRPATKEEIEQNRRFLLSEIQIIKPEYIVTLGNVPLKSITSNDRQTIGKVHGEIQSILILGEEYKLFPLYHPASIIYNKSLKQTYISDIEKLKLIINNR